MNQDILKFIFLCYIFSGLINVAVSVFARIYSRHKEFNLLISYWIYFFAIFIYSFFFHETHLQIASSYFFQSIGINLLVQIVGQKSKWYRPLAFQIPAFMLSAFLLSKTDLGFALSLVPATIALGLPLFLQAWITLVKNRPITNWAEKSMAVLFILFALHNVDFLFLRLDPVAQVFGYSLSLILLQCVSLFVPMAINLRREELERKNITSALERISNNQQNTFLETEEMYQNLTLQISQKEILFRELKASNTILAEEKLVNELLIRTITHDLSSPLTNISNYCELLGTDKIDVGEKEQIWGRINFNALAAITKITNTKNAIRSREMAADTLLEEVSLNESVQVLMEKYAEALRNKELFCEVLLPEEIKVIASRETLIEHVLSHLLSNAIKYSSRGQKIIISAQSTPDMTVLFEIRDFGQGLPTSAYEKRILSSLPGTEGETGNGFGIMIMGYFMRRFEGSYSFETPQEGPGTKAILKFRKKMSSFGATPKPPSPASWN